MNNINIKKIESETKIRLQKWCEFLKESGEEGVKGKVSIAAGDKKNNSLLTIDFSENGVSTTWSATIFHDQNYDLDYFYECWIEKYLQSDPHDIEEWKKTLKFNKDNKDELVWNGLRLAN